MSRQLARLRKLRPTGALALAAGLGVNGLSSYLFLAVAGRMLGDANYAPLGTLWLLVFLVGPGFFFPLEQEVGRAVAARLVHSHGAWPVIRRAAVAGLVMMVILVAVAAATLPFTAKEILDGNALLIAALFISLFSFGATYLVKGVLAGTTQLGRYGGLLAVEGVSRYLVAAILAFYGVESAGPYGLLIGLTPFLGILVAIWRADRVDLPGPAANWQELSASLGNLVVASVLAQVLASASPIIVKSVAGAGQQVIAGVFVKAVVISRIPLFLFQAVQAIMLPRLVKSVTAQRYGEFRSFLAKTLALVASIGVLGTAGVVLLGPLVLRWFGSPEPLARNDLALLAAGNAVYLVAMTLAQALVALRYPVGNVIGWGIGCAVFFAVAFSFDGLLAPVEWGLFAGSVTACVVMAVLIVRRLRIASATPGAFVEAADPLHHVVEV